MSLKSYLSLIGGRRKMVNCETQKTFQEGKKHDLLQKIQEKEKMVELKGVELKLKNKTINVQIEVF